MIAIVAFSICVAFIRIAISEEENIYVPPVVPSGVVPVGTEGAFDRETIERAEALYRQNPGCEAESSRYLSYIQSRTD